jgi:iron complex transport system substrate-binding protein
LGTAALGVAAVLQLGFVVGTAVGATPTKPGRIVSLNVCADQLLLTLADRSRIASLTFLAADPSSSAMAEAARGLPTNRGRAEEVLAYNPDLVLAGSTAATPTVQFLKRLGHKVVVVPLAQTLAHIPRNIRSVAKAIGEEARGKRLVARFENDLAQLTRKPPGRPRPRVLLLGPAGVTSGAGTLAGAVMEAAGWDNVGKGFGLMGVGRIPLETALSTRSDLMILSSLTEDYPSLAAGYLAHPALDRANRDRKVIRIYHHIWACGTPHVLGAVRRLSRIRDRLTANNRRPQP